MKINYCHNDTTILNENYYQITDRYYTQEFINVLLNEIEDLTYVLEKAKLVIPTYYLTLLNEIDQVLKKHKN